MSFIRIKSLKIKNYRSFGTTEQQILFPTSTYRKPVAITGYNNAWKTNLINCILYGLQVNFVSKDTFSIDDFHNRNIDNIPQILLECNSSTEDKFDKEKQASLKGFHKLNIYTDGDEIAGSKIVSLKALAKKVLYDGREVDDINYDSFWATKYFNIFYINFHNIKEEISTNKTSWGNLKSFLAKHIKKIVDGDEDMRDKKKGFQENLKTETNSLLEDSELDKFIKKIKKNYSTNLRNNNCEVEFWLPEYEDIFLQMMFKIWLNEKTENLVPINHFWDWYISMFVMAVIQAIAESEEDKCLFLFEEPESFLHENHQKYFYKMVLCNLSERWHQVIYTTHSDQMIDIFDTKGLIRLEINESNETIKKYNNTWEFSPELIDIETEEIINLERYNDFIRNIEPNLNKILFSKKVILVEWPNDLMVYKYVIEKKVKNLIRHREDIQNKEKYAETYLNFHNISIIPHHWKATALYLIEVCKHFGLDYFVINDWDFTDNFIDDLSNFETEEEMKESTIYTNSDKKWMITTNWKLLNKSSENKLHFNVPKLEGVIWYTYDDKNSIKIWNKLEETINFNETLFPTILENFLEFHNLENIETNNIEEEEVEEIKTNDYETNEEPDYETDNDDKYLDNMPF